MNIVISCYHKKLRCGALNFNARIGKAGFTDGELGREGDAMTPLGDYSLRWGFFRADRLPPPPRSKLTFHALQEGDGWCDETDHPAYNRFIKLPDVASPDTPSHEKLWREDGAYDVILVMSHNDSPPISGLGSAVFIHVAQHDDRNTLGCIALAPEDMVKLLPQLYSGQRVIIQE